VRKHRPAFRHQRVAGAHGRADGRHRQASRRGQRGDFTERHFQILANVVAQSLERRNINDFGTVLEAAAKGLANQAVDAGKKRRERLAGAGGRQISVDLPASMDGHPCSCGSVGEPNLAANHS